MRSTLFVVLAIALLPLASARAHEFSPGFLGMVEQTPDLFQVQCKVSLTGGLADALSPQIPGNCTFEGALNGYVMGDARVQQRELRCASGLAGQRIEIAGLPATMTDVLLRIDYLDGRAITQRLTPGAPATVVPVDQGVAAVMGTYLILGVEHILIGIDHLLFVFALLLFVDNLRRLVITVTAFTVAHSITLGAATLGLIQVSQAPVEAVIALSILFLAAELSRRPAPTEPHADIAVRFPWIVAFIFGLLHGFGFAGALAEIGLPTQAVPLALLFFNLGVELGQLIFIFAVLALAWTWRHARLPTPPAWRTAVVYGIGSIAAFWVLDRTVGAI
jgi:hydrogenase/urease accessory protein HupE